MAERCTSYSSGVSSHHHDDRPWYPARLPLPLVVAARDDRAGGTLRASARLDVLYVVYLFHVRFVCFIADLRFYVFLDEIYVLLFSLLQLWDLMCCWMNFMCSWCVFAQIWVERYLNGIWTVLERYLNGTWTVLERLFESILRGFFNDYGTKKKR